ncbi:hypothetical protein [Arthrobacter sp. EPSL27]|uniref:hypothetical protein n=1 Tax=Arthrobacter sp. EPSL27 TaxID=1745378 RepID=UPI001E395150|nr:hypothetical protein [Arthrobacter sp. EPSL27]
MPCDPCNTGSEFSASKPLTVDGDNAHTVPFAASVTAITSDPKLTSAAPGNCLSPPNRICAADTWFNVEPALSSTNTVPASCNTSNVVDAGVTAPSNTRDG